MTDGISTPGSFRTNEEQILIYFVKYEYCVNAFVTAIINAKYWSVIIIFGEGILLLNHSDSQYEIVLW